MKFLLYLLLLFAGVSNGQGLLHIGAPGGEIKGISINITNSDILYCAETTQGSAFVSYDKGQTVVPIRHIFGDYPYRVYGSGTGETETIYLDAIYSGIFKTGDFGKFWFKIAEYNDSGIYHNPFMLNPVEPKILYVIQNNKDLMYSRNSGDTWTKLYTFDKDIRAIAISTLDTSFIYTAADHVVYKSVNSGKDWQKKEIDLNNWWLPFKIVVNPQNKNSIFIHVEGSLLKCVNLAQIDTLYSGDVNDFDVCSNDSSTIYVATGNPFFFQGGGLFKSVNNGQSWQQTEVSLPNFYTCDAVTIDPDDPNTIYASFGQTYGVFRSDDAGENWSLTNLAHANPANFYPLNDKPGEILTIQFFWNMLKTNTFGQEWFYPQFSPPVSYWGDFLKNSLSVNPVNCNIAYYAGKSDLYKTEDGGNSWTGTGSLTYPALVQYHNYNAQIIWTMLDSSYNEYLSMDGGESWEGINIGHTEFPITGPGQRRFNKKETQVIYALGYRDFDYYIVKSTDYFRTWEAYNDGLPRHPETRKVHDIRALEVNPLDPSVLYVALRDYGLLCSSDSGHTWIRIDSTLTQLTKTDRINDILLDENDTSKIYVSIDRHGQPLTENFVIGGLYVTTNGAKSWKEVYRGETSDIRRDNAIPPNIYFATPYGIWMINDSIATAIDDTHLQSPEKIQLKQNYPNPFNPQTTIEYHIARAGLVKLKVYNILGSEVATLIDKHQMPGNYTIIFNGRKLASGVYFYRLIQGDYIHQRKMLLIK